MSDSMGRRCFSRWFFVGCCVVFSGWPNFVFCEPERGREPVKLADWGKWEREVSHVMESRNGKRAAWRDVLTHKGATFLKLRVEVLTEGKGEWELRFSDPRKDSVLHVFAPNRYAKEKQPFSMWTIDLPVDSVAVALHGDVEDVHLKFEDYLYGRTSREVRNILGDTDDLVPVSNYRGQQIHDWGRAVVRLKTIDERGYFTCTGFLVDKDLLITASHCHSDNAEVIFAEFDYDGKQAQTLDIGVELFPAYRDDLFDFMVMKLHKSRTSIPALKLSGSYLSIGDKMVLLQHPSGEPKQVVEKNCSVANGTDRNFLMHTCDTESGSSGAPMLNLLGTVVAMHTGGVNEVGGEWNSGIPAERIFAMLKRYEKGIASRLTLGAD